MSGEHTWVLNITVSDYAPSTDDDESKESTATASRLKRRSRDKRRSTGITPEQSVEDDSGPISTIVPVKQNSLAAPPLTLVCLPPSHQAGLSPVSTRNLSLPSPKDVYLPPTPLKYGPVIKDTESDKREEYDREKKVREEQRMREELSEIREKRERVDLKVKRAHELLKLKDETLAALFRQRAMLEGRVQDVTHSISLVKGAKEETAQIKEEHASLIRVIGKLSKDKEAKEAKATPPVSPRPPRHTRYNAYKPYSF